VTRDLAAMEHREYDLLVIGGGILGCAVARDAAGRGLRVALVEKEDFAYGTTSRSTRLIHGGLRYLELYDFGLVHEGLHEREVLLRTAPHLVRGLPFVTPVYAGDRWRPGMVRAGMVLYDLLSLGKSLPSHRMLSPAQVRELEPGLRSEGLLGGALYYDGQVEFPERLCLASILGATRRGADVANYAAARSLLREGRQVVGAVVEDRLSGKEHRLRARVVLNAAGPWADEVARLADPRARPVLRRTKGIHLVVPAFTRHAVVLLARRDGRVFFAVPWAGRTLVGTTDTDYECSPDLVRAEPEEVAYLVEETRRVFPQANLGQIQHAMAGVRALVRSRRAAESAVSRKHRVLDHAGDGAPGLISLFGGKITGARAIAAEAVDVAAHRLGVRRASTTTREPYFGGEVPPERLRPEVSARAAALGLESDQAEALVALYGTAAGEVLALAEAEPELARRLTPDRPEILAQVHYAVHTEMARTSADFLWRRTGIGYAPDHGLSALPAVSQAMGRLLGWSVEEQQRDLRRADPS